jgi:hypothetical protein
MSSTAGPQLQIFERGLSRGSDLSMLLAPLRPGYGPTRAPVQTMIIIQIAKPIDRLAAVRANISISMN